MQGNFQWIDSLTSVLITKWIYWLFNTLCFFATFLLFLLHDLTLVGFLSSHHAWCVLSTNKAKLESFLQSLVGVLSYNLALLKTAKKKLWFFWRRLYRDASRTVTCSLRWLLIPLNRILACLNFLLHRGHCLNWIVLINRWNRAYTDWCKRPMMQCPTKESRIKNAKRWKENRVKIAKIRKF